MQAIHLCKIKNKAKIKTIVGATCWPGRGPLVLSHCAGGTRCWTGVSLSQGQFSCTPNFTNTCLLAQRHHL